MKPKRLTCSVCNLVFDSHEELNYHWLEHVNMKLSHEDVDYQWLESTPESERQLPKVRSAQQVKLKATEFKMDVKRARAVLQPTPAQKITLERMFDAPQALAKLLQAYPQKITNLSEASLFLLKNRKALDGFINPRARTESVNLLTDLLIQWSDDPPDVIGIDFDDCSISAQQEIYLPMDGFRRLGVSDPTELIGQLTGACYEGPFTLFREDKSFVVTFNLVRRMEEVISLTSKKVRKNSLAGSSSTSSPPNSKFILINLSLTLAGAAMTRKSRADLCFLPIFLKSLVLASQP